MPTYEYACRSCAEVFDVYQSMRDAPLTSCPKCGKPGLKRLIGRGAGIIFKGSGFYETDYKRAGQKSEAGATKAESGGESKGGSTSAAESSKGSDSGKSSASSSSSSTTSD
ncbi:MAG: FmdB family zinc ribbon protein [Opitutaceae bacterium]